MLVGGPFNNANISLSTHLTANNPCPPPHLRPNENKRTEKKIYTDA